MTDTGHQIIQSNFRKELDAYPLLILISDGKASMSQYSGKPFAEAMEMVEEIKNDTRVNTAVVPVPMSDFDYYICRSYQAIAGTGALAWRAGFKFRR